MRIRLPKFEYYLWWVQETKKNGLNIFRFHYPKKRNEVRFLKKKEIFPAF